MVKISSSPDAGGSIATLAADAMGNVVIFGNAWGVLGLGGGTVAQDGQFVAKFDPQGNLLWANMLFTGVFTTNQGNIRGTAIDFGPEGDIVLSGTSHGNIGTTAPDVSYDGVYFPEDDSQDYGFVIKINGSSGAGLWGRSFRATGGWGAGALDVATDTTGAVFITGGYKGIPNFGGGTLPSNGRVFLTKLLSNGDEAWSKGFVATSDALGTSIEVDAIGRVHLLGWFSNTLDLGGGVQYSAQLSDIFTGVFDASGTYVSSNHYAAEVAVSNESMAITHSGTKWITGIAQGAIDFGGGILQATTAADPFLVAFDNNGAHVCSRMYHGPYTFELSNHIASDMSDRAAIWGQFAGTIDIEGRIIEGNTDMSSTYFAASYEGDCKLRWIRAFTGNISASVAGTDPSGAMWIGGTASGTIDFGKGPISAPNGSLFLVKLAP